VGKPTHHIQVLLQPIAAATGQGLVEFTNGLFNESSYLFTFHDKGLLLGKAATGTCSTGIGKWALPAAQ